MSLNRRSFLSTTSGAAVAAAFTGISSPRSLRADEPAVPPVASEADGVQNIIHLVADGVSWGTLTCADHLSHRLRGRGLTWLELMGQPDVASAVVDMRSLNSLVTDSAAAACLWGCGARILNAMVNLNSEGSDLPNLYTLLGQKGWHRGLVTTAEVTHATPAGFAANVLSRSMGEAIASQYIERGIEVLMGGARRHFTVGGRLDRKNLIESAADAGYSLFQNRDEMLRGAVGKRLLGLFAEGHLPYTVDQRRSRNLQRLVPTLAEMSRAALEHLVRQEHFVLQVEGGRVDHACHANDAAAAFFDMIAFDEAIDVCLDFQRLHPRTLIVITTDHGNANPGLNGMGSSYKDSTACFDRIGRIQCSSEVLLGQLKKADSSREMASILEERTGYRPDEGRLQNFLPFLKNEGCALFDQRKSDSAGLGQLLANYTGIGFIGTSHTSDYVPLTALGPGSKRFAGKYSGNRVFDHYMDLAGIDFRNPQEPLMDGKSPSADAAEHEEWEHHV